MQWMALTVTIEKRNRRLFRRTAQLVSDFRSEGMSVCILKGQGNALMYPNPYSRQAGDIDVWVEGEKKDILHYVKQKTSPKQIQYHHVDFPVDKEVQIELHFTPCFFQNPLKNRRLQRYYGEERGRQMQHETLEPDGLGTIVTPTDDFNLFFQLLHIYKHFLYEGIGLRQVIDYYYLLLHVSRSASASETRGQAISLIHRFGVVRFAGGLMWLLSEVLGLGEEHLLLCPEEKTGRLILQEILRTGNFGRHDDRLRQVKESKGLKHYLLRQQYFLRYLRYFPDELLWSPYHAANNYLTIRWNKYRYIRRIIFNHHTL